MEPEEKQLKQSQAAANSIADDDKSTGNEADDAAITGRELDHDDITGSELDDDDITGIDFGDDDITGNDLDVDLTGDELDEVDDAGNTTGEVAVAHKQTGERSEAEPPNEKSDAGTQPSAENSARLKAPRKIILAAAGVILLGVVGVIGTLLWSTSSEIELETAAVEAPEAPETVPLSMNAFLIPFSRGKFSYISLNVSINVPTGRVRNEIIAKKDMIRGRIYELLLVYARDLANSPAPNEIKAIISKSINGLLSNGSVHELYLTQFIVI